jgi:signal transduction histidine kinase/HAMP domain-containing protein
MRIRNKLLLAMAVPAGLLAAQIASVSFFVRQLQSAVTFISSAHAVIEADFDAVELIGALRDDVKQLPSNWVAEQSKETGASPLPASWNELTSLIDVINASKAAQEIEPSVLDAVVQAFGEATEEYRQTQAVAASGATDLNGLIERAIFTDKALVALAEALNALAVELRKQLQAAVDREREIHDRPLIAGMAIGGLALVLLVAFAWLYVDRTLAGPIHTLQDGAKRIGRGDLRSRIEVKTGDELQSLAEHFNQMAGQLQESYATLEDKVEERTRQLARSVKELEALGEVSRAINSTLDLRAVLKSIAAHAVALAEADAGAFCAYDEEAQIFRLQATHELDPGVVEAFTRRPIHLGEGAIGRAGLERRAVQIPDIDQEAGYALYEIIRKPGYRALLAVPLLREDSLVGGLVLCRKTPGAFASETVDLVQTLANQSVLAIENAELFEEIEQKGRELAAASRHKSEFLANMSHELRTPLNAVLGYAELIQDGIYGDVSAKMQGVLERIQQNGRHLLGLINAVLDLSKIEAGQLMLQPADYSMRELALGVISATEALAAGKKLVLEVDVPADLPPGRGDERRITQVLLNLVGNAIKFTDAGSVGIRARVVDGSFLVAVSDTGAGIAAEDQERIFEEFQQVDTSSTRRKGGTGLGLAIARRIVELHGGRIWVESTPGQGTIFYFTLPLRVGEREEAA